METKITNTYTAIYANGGGNWITESHPTNFHHFYKEKMLTAAEHIEDFMEVTEAEKTALEAADAQWVRPPQSFIDQWNEAAGQYGGYNEDTGYFELNGLTDITYDEALAIYSSYHGKYYTTNISGAFVKLPHRTLLPIYIGNTSSGMNCTCSRAFFNMTNLEVVKLSDCTAKDPWGMFAHCKKLKYIYGNINISSLNNSIAEMFLGCIALQEVSISNLKGSISLSDSPLLSRNSLDNMVTNSSNTSAITITVHPDVYAKIIDEANEEWHSLLPLAAEKNIQFATT